jgi:hypothetical protein
VHYNTARPHQGIAQRVSAGRTRHSSRNRNRRRHTADPPKTRPQRPDQRICARRMTPGRPAGHLPKSYFRAGQPSCPVLSAIRPCARQAGQVKSWTGTDSVRASLLPARSPDCRPGTGVPARASKPW